ncbi:MAG: DNA polymerase III subunit delta [Paraprevotella sp.]|nr:DNA polymerase III subunit delta [Paraprevotella sp.]
MFSQVIGQAEVKMQLLREAQEGRVPHALLFCGPPGCGKLALAVSYAQYLLCQHPGEQDACGTCPSCKASGHFVHPDLHFVFPVIRYKTAESTVCDVYLEQWRKRLKNGLYFDLDDWLADMKAENQQALIYAAESNRIQRKLAMKSTLGGRKVMVIWMPEKMNAECANKLLKLIEEPPAQTHFLLVSDEPDKILPTILSRTQRIEVKGIDHESMVAALRRIVPSGDVETIARNADGSYTAAIKSLDASRDNLLFFDLFVMLMRLSYQRKIKEMRKWSEQIAGMGRERQKNFLTYCQRLIRENFIYNFHSPELNYMTPSESEFSKNFARFVNERNVIPIMNELSHAQQDIEQNVNPRIVFFDFALKMIVLLIQ